MTADMSKANEMGKSIPSPSVFIYTGTQSNDQATIPMAEVVFHLFTSKGIIKSMKGYGGPAFSADCTLIIKAGGFPVLTHAAGAFDMEGTDLSVLPFPVKDGDTLTASITKAGGGLPILPFSLFFVVEAGG